MSEKRPRTDEDSDEDAPHGAQGSENERKAQLQARRDSLTQAATELGAFMTQARAELVEHNTFLTLLKSALEENDMSLASIISMCNSRFYGKDFKHNAHREALLDLLFKIRDAAQPPGDQLRGQLLSQLDRHIRDGVAVAGLLDLDHAIRRKKKELAAFNHCFAVVIDRGSDDLFDGICRIRDGLQPAHNEFAEFVAPLHNLMREHKDNKAVLDALCDVDEKVRLDQSAVSSNLEKLITAINTAFRTGRASSAGDDFFAVVLRIHNAAHPPHNEFAEFVAPLHNLMREHKDNKAVLDALCDVDEKVRLDLLDAASLDLEKLITAIRTSFKMATAASCGAELSAFLIGLRKKACVDEKRNVFLDELYNLIGRAQQDSTLRHLSQIDAALNDLGDAVLEPVNSCISDLLRGGFQTDPIRKGAMQLALHMDTVILPFPSNFAAMSDELTRSIVQAHNLQQASKLRHLRDALRVPDVNEQTYDAQKTYNAIDECGGAGAPADLIQKVRNCLPGDWLQRLKDAARLKNTIGTHFFPSYKGHLAGVTGVPVVFLGQKDHGTVEDRVVPTKFQRDMVRCENNWDKLVALTGPSGTGKTVMGLFGLAGERKVLVYIGAPPQLLDAETASQTSKAVQNLVDQAHAAEASNDTVRKRALLRDAIGLHLREKLTEIFGEWRGSEQDSTEVIFFFDELGQVGKNADDVRIGVRELAGELHDSPTKTFRTKLMTELGLKVCGFAMGGTGLDAERAMGSLGNSDKCLVVKPNCAGLTWKQFNSNVDEDSMCTPDERATLDAVRCLPRLTALVLYRASSKTGECTIPMKLLHDAVTLAVDDFMRLSGLKELVPGRATNAHDKPKEVVAAQWRMQVAQCCFKLLFLPPPCSMEELTGLPRSVISRFGLVYVLSDENESPVRLSIGRGQRLVLRHFFRLAQHVPSGAGFEHSVADFLCFVVPLSRGKTLSEFLEALNRFFSHQFQHPDDYEESRKPAAPSVTAPEDMAEFDLAASSAVVWDLHFDNGRVSADALDRTKTINVDPNQCTVLINDDEAAAWDLQWVLPLVDKHKMQHHITFDIQVKRYIHTNFSQTDFDHEKKKVAGVRRMALPRTARDGGFIAVVGRPLWQADWAATNVWHVNMADPGSLGVVPFTVVDRADDAIYVETTKVEKAPEEDIQV